MLRLPVPLVAITLIMVAVCPAAEPTPPPHPTLVYAEYKEQRYLVVAADKAKPVIEIDGKRLSLPEDTPLLTERAPGYAGIFATFKSTRSTTEHIESSGTRLPGSYQEINTELVAAQDLHDCFLVIIQFEEEFLMTDEEREKSRGKAGEIFHDRPVAKPQIHVQQIADLKADQPATITFSSIILLDARYTNLPLAIRVSFKTFMLYPLFAGGQEVKTNQPDIAATYFHHREKLIHTLLLQRWVKQNGTTDQPLRPVLQIPPLFDSVAGFPLDATATLTVAADGSVSEVKLDRDFPAEAETIINNTLRAWLFLPKLQKGTPAAARVKVPLRF